MHGSVAQTELRRAVVLPDAMDAAVRPAAPVAHAIFWAFELDETAWWDQVANAVVDVLGHGPVRFSVRAQRVRQRRGVYVAMVDGAAVLAVGGGSVGGHAVSLGLGGPTGGQ